MTVKYIMRRVLPLKSQMEINFSIRKTQQHHLDRYAVEYHNEDQFWYKKETLYPSDSPTIKYHNGDQFCIRKRHYILQIVSL
jgi:hypothetical protein